MADTIVPISLLPELTNPGIITNSDYYPLVNNNVTQKIAYSTIYNDISSKIVAGKYPELAAFNDSQALFGALSGNWQNTYNTVNALSGTWGTSGGSGGTASLVLLKYTLMYHLIIQ